MTRGINMTCNELFDFKKTENGYTLARYLMADSADITELEIPPEYLSEPVTAIGDSAFAGARYLRSVILPDSIERIGGGAFANCADLFEIKLPQKIYCISTFMFSGCVSLKRIDIPDGVTMIDEAFTDCVSLEKIVLPKYLRSLEGAVFDGCTNLRSVVFQSVGVYVDKYAFGNCPALPPETVMRALVPGDDITEPFIYSDDEGFDWWTALRQDVFELAMKYDSFSQTDKSVLFYMLFSEELFAAYYPIMRESGWLYREENITGFEKMLSDIFAGESRDNPKIWDNMDIWVTDKKLLGRIIAAASRRGPMSGGRTFPDKLIERSVSLGKTEATAWLLEYKSRKLGFDRGEKFEL